MTLFELITLTKEKESEIRQEHEILRDFHLTHPWIIEENIKSFIKNSKPNTPIPNFNSILNFKEDYLINDLSKVYNQLITDNPLLINLEVPFKIYFYSISKNLYKQQVKKGLNLGENDNQGNLVTGSSLLITIVDIIPKDFLEVYYTVLN